MSDSYIRWKGEYEPTWRHYSRLNARLEFVNAISRCVPNVFEALHDEPLKKYQESGLLKLRRSLRARFWGDCFASADPTFYLDGLVREGMISKDAWSLTGGNRNLILGHVWQFFSSFGLDPNRKEDQGYYRSDIHPRINVFFDCLELWAEDHNLKVGWMLHWAYLKLDSYADPDDRRNDDHTYHLFELSNIFGREIQPTIVQKASLSDWGIIELALPGFSINSAMWRPLIQDEKEYTKRVREDFERELERYLLDSKRLLDLQPNLAPFSEKATLEHYEWLARYQCQKNESMRGLAVEVNQSYEAVRDAVHNLSAYIGLPLRKPGKAGRRSSRAKT